MTTAPKLIRELVPLADALENSQQQCDADGTMIAVSRQAVDETIRLVRSLAAEPVGCERLLAAVTRLERDGDEHGVAAEKRHVIDSEYGRRIIALLDRELSTPAQPDSAEGDPTIVNPYTGAPRDIRDVESDPTAILCTKPGEPLRAAHLRATDEGKGEAGELDAIRAAEDEAFIFGDEQPKANGGDLVMVPRNPTPAMLRAGFLSESEGFDIETPADAPGLVYRAMIDEALSAAPQPGQSALAAEYCRGRNDGYESGVLWARHSQPEQPARDGVDRYRFDPDADMGGGEIVDTLDNTCMAICWNGSEADAERIVTALNALPPQQAFIDEWANRFGHLAAKHDPRSIESIDEVARLLDEKQQADGGAVAWMIESPPGVIAKTTPQRWATLSAEVAEHWRHPTKARTVTALYAAHPPESPGVGD